MHDAIEIVKGHLSSRSCDGGWYAYRLLPPGQPGAYGDGRRYDIFGWGYRPSAALTALLKREERYR